MPRISAWLALENDFPLRALESIAEERGLERRDRALARAILGLEIRRRGTLARIVRAFTRRPPERALANHLHLGLVQLLWLDRVPPHAALSASVDAARETLGRSAAGFVNAVLRAAQRSLASGRSGDPRRDLVDRELHFDRPVLRDPAHERWAWGEDAWSIPATLLRRWAARWGDERALALARAFHDEPPLSLRTVRGTPEELTRELASLEVEARAGSTPRALLVPSASAAAVLDSEAFRSGRITVQGETASAAAEVLEARAGERLLDCCAAPGGKTAILLEAGAAVVACDVDRSRLALVRETCARLGLESRLELVESDGTRNIGAGLFDGVLVDAPCSNTGVLGARPEARWRFGKKELASLVELQRRLLLEGAERVRPGGRLVWSTCSLEPEENGELVRAFLVRRPTFELVEERETLPDVERGPIDGGYAARLVRRA